MTIRDNGNKHYIADLSLLLVTLIWGLSFTLLKNILGQTISPVVLVFTRFLLASIVLFPFCFRRLKNIDRNGLLGGILLGALLFGGFCIQSIGIQFTTASKSAFITGLSSLFVPFFLFLHVRKAPGMVNGMAIIIAIFGMYLLTDPAGGINYGDILTLICAAIFGAHIYVMGRVAPGRDFLAIAFIQLFTTSALALLFIPVETVEFEMRLPTITAVIYLGTLATAVAVSVQAWAQQRTSPVKAGIMFTAEPVFAYMFASILLNDHLDSIQKIGGGIIIAAVIASEIIPPLISKIRKN